MSQFHSNPDLIPPWKFWRFGKWGLYKFVVVPFAMQKKSGSEWTGQVYMQKISADPILINPGFFIGGCRWI